MGAASLLRPCSCEAARVPDKIHLDIIGNFLVVVEEHKDICGV
jgi:hypothetical protein